MSSVQPTVVALAIADLHLCEKTPRARAESDWYAVMTNYLEQLRDLARKHFYPPVLLAGDCFDAWRASPELINFALQNLPPKCYAVSGQHEQPHHNPQELHRSAYQTLALVNRLVDLRPGEPLTEGNLRLYGFRWGTPVQPLQEPHDLLLEIAVVHRYAWIPGKQYQGAPDEGRLRNLGKSFAGYDVVVIGDNHKPWMAKMGSTTILNCGSFFRRHVDEIDHKPSVGLIYRDGSVGRHYLDTSKDQFLPPDQIERQLLAGVDMRRFADSYASLQHAYWDFEQEVRRDVDPDKVREVLREAVLTCLENGKTRKSPTR